MLNLLNPCKVVLVERESDMIVADTVSGMLELVEDVVEVL